MIELQLVGYTADLEYLVFCDVAEGASRFKAHVDEDLLATLTEVVDLTDPAQRARLMPLPVVEAPPPPPPPPPPTPPPPPRSEASRGPAPGEGPLAAVALLLGGDSVTRPDGAAPAVGEGGGRLPPRDIQALLRSGKTPSVIAKQAGTDEAWVRRWLPPIEAERERVVAAVREARITKARLGPSAEPLGRAVDGALAAKGATEDVEWLATRRDGAPYWVVAVRYRSRGRLRRARFRYDPETREVEAEDQHATDLAWARPGGRRRATRTSTPTAARTGPAPPPAKAQAVKKQSARTQGAKTQPARKQATKTQPARKQPAKNQAAKKQTPRKQTAPPPPPEGAKPGRGGDA